MFAKVSRTLIGAPKFQGNCRSKRFSKSNLRLKPINLAQRTKITTAGETKIITPARVELFKRNGKLMARSVFAIGTSLALGDCLCQVLENGKLKSYERTATMFTIGTFVTGPLSHSWNMILENKLPGNTVVKIIQKTLLNSIYAFSISLPVMFTAVTLFSKSPSGERGTLQDAKLKIARDLVPTFIAGCFYWPVFNFLVFRFVTASNRAVASSIIATVWNVYLASVANSKVPFNSGPALQQEL